MVFAFKALLTQKKHKTVLKTYFIGGEDVFAAFKSLAVLLIYLRPSNKMNRDRRVNARLTELAHASVSPPIEGADQNIRGSLNILGKAVTINTKPHKRNGIIVTADYIKKLDLIVNKRSKFKHQGACREVLQNCTS